MHRRSCMDVDERVCVYINSWQLMEPLTRINCDGLCARSLSLIRKFSVHAKLSKWFSMWAFYLVSTRLMESYHRHCLRNMWEIEIVNESERDGVAAEVERANCECLFVSAMYDIRVRYSNFRPSVHISKLFTCGCTNLIKSFTLA